MNLSALSDELSQVRTRKKDFLTKIDCIVPWGEWLDLIRTCYYKGERGNKPYDLGTNAQDLSDTEPLQPVRHGSGGGGNG